MKQLPRDGVDLLRLADEPCRCFGEREIHDRLMTDAAAFMDRLERFYLDWRRGVVRVRQPMKQVFTTDGLPGDLRVMPCVIERDGEPPIKCVKVIGTNEASSVVLDKICVGKAMLVHPLDNFVEAVFDVCALSSFRTAAIAVLAWKHAGGARGPVGLIGAGRIGCYTAWILRAWLNVEHLFVHDPDAASVARFRRFLGNAVAVDEGSLDAVCEASASLLLATTSPTPILDARRVAGAVFVASVGADADNLSELDPSVLPGRRIVSESRQNIHLGDLRRWRDAGRLAESDIVELRELVGEGGGIEEPGPGVVFISTGAALQDALVCDYLARGPEAGSGTGRAVPPASAARRPAASH